MMHSTNTSKLNPACEDVCIVVVAFNPAIAEFHENLSSYAGQVKQVIVCDNSDDTVVQGQVIALLADVPNAMYVPMGGNIGIAAAQNRGIRQGISAGYDYFIEIDQDSRLPPGFVARIRASYVGLAKRGYAVAGIGPVAIRADGFVYDGQIADQRVVEVDKTLSSGFFFSKVAFERVGPKDESLFIDYVDWEWCWRAAEMGLRTYVDRTIAITHMLGSGHRRILGFNVGLPAPIRHYYQYRNGLYMLKRRYVPLSWRLKRVVIMVLKTPIYAFFVGDGHRRRTFIARGIIDACRRRAGKIAS